MNPITWINGYKSVIAAALAAFVAFNEIYPITSPQVSNAIFAAAAALGLVGIRHAIAKGAQK